MSRPAFRPSVFDEFTRLHDRTRIQGHGLGLAIARRIAALLGGYLTVADAQGPGASFAVSARAAHVTFGLWDRQFE